MESKITSAIDMRRIQNIAQANKAMATVTGYCIAESENPKKSHRSDYLAVRRWLKNIATIHGYPSLQGECRELLKSLELTLQKANHYNSSRTQKFKKHKSNFKNRR